MSDNVLLVDGSYLIHRMKYRAWNQGGSMASSDGICFLFMKSLLSTIYDRSPTGVVILWDYGIPKHRFDAVPDYKGNRNREMTDDRIAMESAREQLTSFLPRINILSYGHDGAEADDLAYLLTRVFKSGLLISEDDDWTQSITPNFNLYKPMANKTTTYNNLVEWYSFDGRFNPTQVHSYIKAITGDSDNIPKVMRGVGYVNAKKAVFEMLQGNPMPKNLDTVRDQIETNYRAIDMSWILGSRVPIINDMIEKVKQLNNKLDISDWMAMVTKINAPSLVNQYHKIKPIAEEFDYSSLK